KRDEKHRTCLTHVTTSVTSVWQTAYALQGDGVFLTRVLSLLTLRASRWRYGNTAIIFTEMRISSKLYLCWTRSVIRTRHIATKSPWSLRVYGPSPASTTVNPKRCWSIMLQHTSTSQSVAWSLSVHRSSKSGLTGYGDAT